MKRMLFLAVIIALLGLPVTAQEDVAPGEGLPIIEGNSSGSINIGSLNPLRCLATDCSTVTGLLFPTVFGVDPETAFYAPGAPDGLAADWEISEDGLTYTIDLREDLFWSDGEQINADDVVFTLEAILSDEIESTQSASLLDVIAGVEKVDDFTVNVTLQAATCTALGEISTSVIPEHVFADFTDMVDNDFDRNPSVTSGVFTFGQIEEGERVVLLADQEYEFADGVIPQGWLYVDVPSTSVEFERFLAGELNLIAVPTENRSEIRERTDEFQIAEWPSNSWSYIGLNNADPDDPQPAFDEDGNRVDQGGHPLFGDRNVRRAMQHAIDVQSIIDGALFGEGVQMASAELPTSWALNPDLDPVAFDPEMAAAMLDEAGFPLGDDGIRVANEDAMFAEPGTPFEFELIYNDGSEAAGRVVALVQDQLREIGVTVVLSGLDFNTAIDLIGGQVYDAYLLGWQNGFPVDPDLSFIFNAAADEPPFGFNDTSYFNEELFDLIEQGRTLPGCDQEERAEIYYQVQEILQEEQPYIWLYSGTTVVAASSDVGNFDPFPNQTRWNIQEWVRTDQ